MKKIITEIIMILLLSITIMTSSCATLCLDQSNRAEQVTITFDKTIK